MNAFWFRVKMWVSSIIIALLLFSIFFAIVSFLYGGASSLVVGYALTFSIILLLVQWAIGPKIIEMSYKLKDITNDKNYIVVTEMIKEIAKKEGINNIKIYVADVNFYNAFSFGNAIYGKAIAITRPMFSILNKDELRAVVEHEIGHLKHKDVELLLALSLLPSAIYWLGYSLMFSNDRNEEGPIIGLALLIVSFVFQIFILYFNRNRELFADYNAAEKGDGKYLETALAKIYVAEEPPHKTGRKSGVTSMLMLVNPKSTYKENYLQLIEKWKHQKVSFWEDLLLDHPHPARRIQFLERLGGTQ